MIIYPTSQGEKVSWKSWGKKFIFLRMQKCFSNEVISANACSDDFAWVKFLFAFVSEQWLYFGLEILKFVVETEMQNEFPIHPD